MHKQRGYKRETPVNLVRDYKLFAIACEGSKTEPGYFNAFRYMSKKIAVDIIENIVSEEEAIAINPNKSAPKWVLDRAIKYIEKEGLNDEDDLWFVMDIDRWSEEQLREIASYCAQYPNWHIVLSNPCFEVWLYLHKKSNIKDSAATSCKELKLEISTFEKGGYHPYTFIPFLPEAITNAKALDSNNQHFFPQSKESKVYQLGEAILKIVGKNDFDNFVNTILPKLTLIDVEKAKVSKRRSK